MKKQNKVTFSAYIDSVRDHLEFSDAMATALKHSKSKVESLAQLRVLSVLNDSECPMRNKDIIKKALVLGPSLSRITKTLHKLKLIKMKKDRNDSRSKEISITEKGKRNYQLALKDFG